MPVSTTRNGPEAFAGKLAETIVRVFVYAELSTERFAVERPTFGEGTVAVKLAKFRSERPGSVRWQAGRNDRKGLCIRRAEHREIRSRAPNLRRRHCCRKTCEIREYW